MAFCAICENYHDTDLPCVNESKQALRGVGIEEDHHKSGPQFRKFAKLADRFMLKVFIIAFAGFLALVILAKLSGAIR